MVTEERVTITSGRKLYEVFVKLGIIPNGMMVKRFHLDSGEPGQIPIVTITYYPEIKPDAELMTKVFTVTEIGDSE